MEERMILISKENAVNYMTAGKALFTVMNTESGGRFTFKVVKVKENPQFPGERWFVKVMKEHNANYLFIGTVLKIDETFMFRWSPKSELSSLSKEVVAFEWTLNNAVNRSIPEKVKLYHYGRCARCGRIMTDPVSIERGIGPECWEKSRWN